ncbi:mechanosensitive ion channel family protein [Termitidicoccus mucosus]|uniref:mechanosensitive ion channel family protein n=1 Tax=Termitidicoccus mucosus TaxID=1184151 RepID=UPI000838DC08
MNEQDTDNNYITGSEQLIGFDRFLREFLASQGLSESTAGIITNIVTGGTIILIAMIAYWLVKVIIVRNVHRLVAKSSVKWDDAVIETRLFARLAHLAPAIIIGGLGRAVFAGNPAVLAVLKVCIALYFIVIVVGVIFSFLDTLYLIAQRGNFLSGLPIKGIVQAFKLVIFLIAAILVISVLFGKSPLVILSGLGALAAVLMLVFKDTIMGFTAGIMLSANEMVRVGDWIEMPSAGADGDVIDVSLTTVKVQNWDKTITTIPAYNLISGSFKNWRGMSESGGRRIKRSIHVDMQTVRFANEEMLARWQKIDLIRPYLDAKLQEIAEDNKKRGADTSILGNGRRLTNLGTFRAYCLAYLKSHPKIHQQMTMIVRQLEPKELGIPLELYTFTNDIGWVAYEGIQSDIFDHLLSVIGEFGLAVYQRPSGADNRALLTSLVADTTAPKPPRA